MKTASCLLVCFFILTSIQPAYATKITWKTGTAINVNWNEPSNWDLNRIPISTDSVFTFYSDFIELPTSYTAEINFMRHLGSLTIPATSELIFTNGQFDALGALHNYGTIRVNNSPEEGIVCSTQASNKPFNNYGNIYIDNSTTKGLVISSNQVITNATGALIEVTNSGEESMALGYPFLNGIINNSGIVKLGVGGNGIGLKIDNSDSEFNNLACGKIILLDKLVMSAGTLDNTGFFKQNFDGDNDLGVLTNTTLNNHGVVEDRFASFYIADFDIQSIWVKIYENKQFKTGEKVPIFTLGTPVGINTGDIFTDKLLTQNAGTYNLNTNTWIPNPTANGKTRFYIRMSQQSNTCFDTIRFDLELPVLAVNYWLGGTGAWQTAAKWSIGTVPTAGDVVAIYDAADQVGISNYTASAKKVFLGGKLTNTLTGILNVNGEIGDAGMDVEDGIIVNNGVINIFQSGLGMDVENGSLTNNNLIKCTNTTLCIDFSTFPGGTGSLTNNGTIENTGGTLLVSDETIVENFGSLIGYNPTYESIRSNELHNTGTIYIEGDGVNATGFSGGINNMATGVITLKKLSNGGKFSGENEGVINAELCNRGFQVNGAMINAAGGNINAMNNATGLYVDDGYITNSNGGKITLRNNTLYGLQLKDPATFQTVDLVNEGIIEIKETIGIGIYNKSEIVNQGNGIIRIKESSSHGIHLTAAIFSNLDQGELDIKDSGGHGILNEGAYILNNHDAKITIDTVGMSGIYFGDFFTGFANVFGYMRNFADLEIGANIAASSLHLETGTSITSFECAGEIICRSKIQLDGLFSNFGVYHHLSSAPSIIGSNLQNSGVVYDPFGSLGSPGSGNDGIYIGQKSGTFNEGEIINDILEISATIPTGFKGDASWFINENLSIPAGDYDESQNTFLPLGSMVDSSKVYFTVTNSNCIPAEVHKFSLKLENPIAKVCGKIIWEGGKGTWSSIDNWSKYRVPSTCDSTIIGGVLDSVLINTVQPIELGHISNKGYLFLKSGANLSVKDNVGNGIRNEGEIVVRGSLTIDNVTLNGYLGTANSTLDNEGMIMIQNVGLRGLILNNATFQNTSIGSLSIQNALLEEIRLGTGSVLNQQGLLILSQ